MYSILIKDSKTGMFRFLTVKQEIMKEQKETIEDESTHEVKEVTTEVGTCKYETVSFETKERDELEKKCIELLNSYKATEFLPIDTLKYSTDLIWDADKKNE